MRSDDDLWLFTMDLPVRTASALAGAVLGSTAGMLGGVLGMGAFALVGAIFGALGGRLFERHLHRLEALPA